jgi:hypothetical protein
MTGNTDIHMLVTISLKKEGVWIRKAASIWCDHLPHSVSHLLHIELIRLLVVACGMLSHSFQWLCEVAGYWRELEHTFVQVDPEHPTHAQLVTCLVRPVSEQGQG